MIETWTNDRFIVYFITSALCMFAMWVWENFRLFTNGFVSTKTTPMYKMLSKDINNFCGAFWVHLVIYFIGLVSLFPLISTVVIQGLLPSATAKIANVSLVSYLQVGGVILIILATIYITPKAYRWGKSTTPNKTKKCANDFVAWWKGNLCPRLK